MYTNLSTRKLEAMASNEPNNADLLDELVERYMERISEWHYKHPEHNGYDTPYLTGCWNKFNAYEDKLGSVLAVLNQAT